VVGNSIFHHTVSRHPEFLTVPPPGGPPGPTGLLDASTSAAALAVAAEVAARVADPARVARLVAVAAAQTAHPTSVHWRNHAVGQGHAGLALLFDALDHHLPGAGWDRAAHHHLALAARAAEGLARPPAGLFAGLAGIGLVASCLSGDGSRYRRLLATIDQALVARTPDLVGALDGPARWGRDVTGGSEPDRSERKAVAGAGPGGSAGGQAVREFDLISGLAGVGAYLLLRRAEPGPAAALRAVLDRLVELTGSDAAGPRWRTPPDALSPDERTRYPNGYLNCGLAHGIPGPLAVLALALREGIEIPGLAEAVAATAAWVATHRADVPSGPNWPNAIPLPDRPVGAPAAAGSPEGEGGARAAWCYGGPGVAASLRLAGEALGQPGHRDLAAAALSAALARPAGERRTDSPTFCHGQAGLLAVTATFARSTGAPALRRAATALAADLLDQFDPAAPLGYRDLEAGGRAVDQPGLLTGAPGVALALLSATSPAEPDWGRLFLLA
jgi:lantibiotic biosynthesis protein